MRSLSTVLTAAIDAVDVQLVYLVLINFEGEDLRLCSSPHTMFYANEEWIGGGRMLDINWSQEDGTLEAHKCDITLDGLDVATISLALNEKTENARVTVYCALFDPDTNAPLGDFQRFRGTISQIRIIPPSE